MRETVDIAALNSRVKFDKTDVPFDQRQILGDATETGLTRFAGRYLLDYDEHQKKSPKVFEIPFNSTNKWALVIVSDRLEYSVLYTKCIIPILAKQETREWRPDCVHQGCSRACIGQVLHLSQG